MTTERSASRIAGRGIVVTGSGGISAASALRCLADGARVHVVSRSGLTGELAEPHAGLTSSRADLSTDAGSSRAFAEAEAALGSIDGLVAVAGGSARRQGDGPIHLLGTAGLEATVALNLATTTNALREFTARWLASGTQGHAEAVLIGSALGRFPASPLFVTHGYAATKAAIEGLARAAAAHYAPHRLTVNVVAPGLTRTPMATRAQEDETISAYARARQPLTEDGFLEPEAVADACAYFLQAPSVTGQVLYIDGGWSVYG